MDYGPICGLVLRRTTSPPPKLELEAVKPCHTCWRLFVDCRDPKEGMSETVSETVSDTFKRELDHVDDRKVMDELSHVINGSDHNSVYVSHLPYCSSCWMLYIMLTVTLHSFSSPLLQDMIKTKNWTGWQCRLRVIKTIIVVIVLNFTENCTN